MKQLSYAVLKENNYQGYILEQAPEKILQFGTGNFLRAFIGDFVDQMNEKTGFNGKIVISQAINSSAAARINAQEGLYTLCLRGRQGDQVIDDRRVISAVSRAVDPYSDFDAVLAAACGKDIRFIISNTTEAGIVFDPACALEDRPAAAFPAKLTQALYARFKAELPGVIVLPCELIDRNGAVLKDCVHRYADLWKLEPVFVKWLNEECTFCSTLVDRIVPGYPKADAEQICAELGYEDRLLDSAEVFASWVIEGPQSLKDELPFEAAGLPILVVDDVSSYKQRKVRILNGAHTSFVLDAYMKGKNIVRECMQDDEIRTFVEDLLNEEVIPTLDLPLEELLPFAAQVKDRFENPFIDHQLLSISLNSTSKWKVRCLPSLLKYVELRGELPKRLAYSFAAYLRFYANAKERGEGCLVGYRGADRYEVKDDAAVLDLFYELKDADAETLVKTVMQREDLWNMDLTAIPGFEAYVLECLKG